MYFWEYLYTEYILLYLANVHHKRIRIGRMIPPQNVFLFFSHFTNFKHTIFYTSEMEKTTD